VNEMKDVRQNPNEPFRRWFSDDHFDLIAWYGPEGGISGFELCYDKTGHQKALRWQVGKGISCYLVDSGEQSPLANRSPLLVNANGQSDMGEVLSGFEASQEGLPSNLVDVIKSKLREYGQLS
jgi:hypothetical protein